MRVLVTGGAGYIGSVATDLLLECGHAVAVFDNLQQGHRAAIAEAAEFLRGDLASAPAIDAAVGAFRPDVVMHFAANSLVGESAQLPFKYIGDNVQNATNLFRAMDRHGCARVIFSSTANLYGGAGRGPITEDAPIRPGSPYGESKAIIERQLHWLKETRGWNYVCLRYFNAAGATETRGEDHTPETHLIPLVLQAAMGQRREIQLFGDDYDTEDGTNIRDYVHVEDLVQAHILAADAVASRSGTFNLGNSAGYSVKQVIAAAGEVTGVRIPVRLGLRRPGDLPVLVASSERARTELGWRPRHRSIHAIIESAFRWMVQHPQGYAASSPAEETASAK